MFVTSSGIEVKLRKENCEKLRLKKISFNVTLRPSYTFLTYNEVTSLKEFLTSFLALSPFLFRAYIILYFKFWGRNFILIDHLFCWKLLGNVFFFFFFTKKLAPRIFTPLMCICCEFFILFEEFPQKAVRRDLLEKL